MQASLFSACYTHLNLAPTPPSFTGAGTHTLLSYTQRLPPSLLHVGILPRKQQQEVHQRTRKLVVRRYGILSGGDDCDVSGATPLGSRVLPGFLHGELIMSKVELLPWRSKLK